MQRQSVLISAIIGLFIIAWWLGYSIFGQIEYKGPTSNPPTSIPTNNSAQTQPGEQNRRRTAQDQTPTSTEPKIFEYSGWRIENAGDQPTACLEFSKELSASDNIEITDYIKTEPTEQITAHITDQTVCLSGLKFGNDYNLTLLKGLKSAENLTLTDDVNIEISFGERPPYVAFTGNGVILPRVGAQGLAIETINLDQIELEVFRVGDRILARRNPDSGQATAEGNYSYSYRNAGSDVRELVWSGSIDIKSSLNTLTTTVFDINAAIGELRPGAYVVTAKRPHDGDEYDYTNAWRWIISTDLALTSYRSKSGLDITVRSIDKAEPVRNTKLELVADNNEILGTVQTDSSGRAHFDKALISGTGSNRPRMVMAYGTDDDYAVLDFNRSPLDLSAFPIGGRRISQDVDAYMFPDRGVYRPGETTHLTAMLRDKYANSIGERDGEISITKPNGVEFRKIRFDQNTQGTVLKDFEIPTSAPRGVWTAYAKLDGMGVVGSTQFSVEDFVPQKLKVDINIDEAPLKADEVRPFEVTAQFLYGANGSGLDAEGEARVRVDPDPFPELKGYTFGRDDEDFRELFLELGSGATDGSGTLELGLSLKDQEIETSHPLRAEISVGVSEPGGRYIMNSTRIPVRTQDVYLGIKPDFKNRAERNKPANFNIKAVDMSGETIDLDQAEWILVEEDWHYNWYRRNTRWNYRREIRDIQIARGFVDIDSDKGADISQTLNWGNYRLIVKDKNSSSISAKRFSVGWGGASTSDAPDQIQIGVPEGGFESGDTVKLTVNAPYAGVGELVIADDEVRQISTVQVPQGGSEINVKLGDDIGAGVYAMLSLYTPRTLDERPVPRRAVGIGYIDADTNDQQLSVEIDAPKVAKPRQIQNVKLSIGNIPRGETAWLTLAAVDEGVLQVTKYKSPDPESWYFGQKGMSVEIRDDYARLLNPNLGLATIAKSGGDALGGEGLTNTPIKVVALYNGPVETRNGKVTIPLELPDFNGELRLMAVAWTKSALGSASTPMKVRDAVPTLLALPRFMAPGDKAVATVSLDNVDGRSGDYGVQLRADGDLSIDSLNEEIRLEKGERKTTGREIVASSTGVSTVKMDISGPRGYKTVSEFDIQTRSPFLPVTRASSQKLAAGETISFENTLIDGFDAGSTDITLSFARTPGLDPSAYAAAVSRYPYGCTEQTVSAAMPLLYANDIGGVAGIGPLQARQALQKAVDRVASRQGNDGAFGLWSPGDAYARPWIGVYAADFLHRAKDEDYIISDATMNKSYKSLKTIAKMERYPNLDYYWRYYDERRSAWETRHAEAAVYAHYVLTRAGRSDLSDIRYFFDNHGEKLKTPLAWGHMAASLAMMDDKSRSAQAFDKAVSALNYEDKDDYYQSPLRDAAGLLALANEVANEAHIEKIQSAFDAALKPPDRLHTGEQAQVIMAIRSFLLTSGSIDISARNADLKATKGVSKAHLYGSDLGASPSFTNESDQDVWLSTMISGAPLDAPLPVNKGFSLSKSVHTLSGEKANLANVQKGQKFIVKVKFKSQQLRPRQIVLADLLPAGLEIEAILSPTDGDKDQGAFVWLGKLTKFQTQEMRDDRLVAAHETYRKDEYTIAYIVRAVTAGDFIWPGAVVEDMYRPQDQSITEATRITIMAGPEG